MAAKISSPQTKVCYEQLRRTIMHGQLTSGSRLVEEKWARCLGVHRSALREAVILLAHEGLLVSGARGGYFVPQHDHKAREEALEIRIALEIGALRVLELHPDRTPDVGPLRKTCDLMRQMYEAGYEFGFVEADRHFHEQLIDLSGNDRMRLVYRQAPLPMFPMKEPDEEGRRRNMECTLRDHGQVCDHLEAGRIGDAVSVLRRHLLIGHESRSLFAETSGEIRTENVRGSEDVSK